MSLIGAELAERRDAALRKGTEVGKCRAKFKMELKNGTVKLSEILRDEVPEWLASMPAERLLLCAPRVGVRAAHSLLLQTHLGLMQRSDRITTRQRNLLAEELEKIEKLKPSGKRARTKYERGVG